MSKFESGVRATDVVVKDVAEGLKKEPEVVTEYSKRERPAERVAAETSPENKHPDDYTPRDKVEILWKTIFPGG